MPASDRPAGRPLALVTGASSGIGLELSRVLARQGHDLVLVARGGARLDELAAAWRRDFGATVTPIARDLADPDGAHDVVVETDRAGLTVDVLVNNAGFATHGPFVETAAAETLNLLQVNVVSLTHLTRLLLPGMIDRGHGRILNVASTAAFLPGPLMSAYYASKAYVLGFSEGLGEEVRGTGVTVTALCPGPTRTGFATRAGLADSPMFRNPSVMDATAVAEAGYRALARGQAVVVPGLANRLLVQVPRLVPRALLPPIVKRVQGQRR